MTPSGHARAIVRVLEHHAMVYRRTWRGTVFSTFLNPLLYLAALGIGLGAFIDDSNPSGIEGVSYAMFLAPGILVASAMNTATFESTYPVMAGIRWLKTYVAMILSPLDPRHVATGQLLWTGIRVTAAWATARPSRSRTGSSPSRGCVPRWASTTLTSVAASG